MSESRSTTPAGSCPELAPLRRRMRVDAAIRLGLGVPVMVLGGFIWFVASRTTPPWSVGPFTADAWLGMLLLMGPWAAATVVAAVAMQRMRDASQHTASRELDAAEASLAASRRLWPLSPRMHLLYLRSLADLRHVQGRHEQTVLVARELLARDTRLHRFPSQHAELLLLWVESALECSYLADAYEGLTRLSAMTLRLEQRLGRLLLQTRYEVAVAADRSVLHDWPRKAELAELLPQPLCGELHGYLAAAAARAGDGDAARWLWARARLLAPSRLRRIFLAAGLGSPAPGFQPHSDPVDNPTA